MFKEFLEIIQQNGAGVRAYEACANAARMRMQDNPEIAAACFLIASVTQRFADAYADQPLSVDAAGQEFEVVKAYVHELDAAYGQGTPADQLASLNAIAARIGNS